MLQLNAKAFGLACGILWGAWALLLGLSAPVCPWAMNIVNWLSTVYVGYKAGITGSIIGGIWAFVDGGLAGFLVAWLYNKFSKI